jgi:hypothetical protein
MAQIQIENLTVLGDVVHWGDRIRVTPSGMPKGANYHTAAAYPGPNWSARQRATGDAPVEFVVGAGASFAPVNGENTQACVIYSDDDANLANGRLMAITSFTAHGPR